MMVPLRREMYGSRSGLTLPWRGRVDDRTPSRWGGKLGENGCQHRFQISIHLAIPEAQNAIAFAFEKDCAPGVALLRSVGRMRRSVYLDDQLELRTGEVDDEGPDRHLPSK